MADRKMADRKMADRKMADRKMGVTSGLSSSIFLSAIFLSAIFLSAIFPSPIFQSPFLSSSLPRRLFINDEMLLRQKAFCFFPDQPDRVHLLTRLRDGHFVQPLDGHVGVFAPVFDLNHAASGFQSFDDAQHHLSRE